MVAHDWGVLLRALGGKIEPDGTLSDEASPELRRIRRAMERQHRVIEEVLRKTLRSLSAEGAAQDELITVRNERFVIPVKTEFRRRVPGVVHGGSSSGQTVFVEPLEAMEQNNELIRLLDEEQGEIHRILRALTAAMGEEAEVLLAGAGVLAEVESHFARARFAEEFGCVRPVFADSTRSGEAAGNGVPGSVAGTSPPKRRLDGAPDLSVRPEIRVRRSEGTEAGTSVTDRSPGWSWWRLGIRCWSCGCGVAGRVGRCR